MDVSFGLESLSVIGVAFLLLVATVALVILRVVFKVTMRILRLGCIAALVLIALFFALSLIAPASQ